MRILSQLGEADAPVTSFQRFICSSYPFEIILSETLPVIMIPSLKATY